LETLQPPYVLKADRLAAGKGVLIIQFGRSQEELRNMLVHQNLEKPVQSGY
jgi:phosphoribosylamine--glycine ligase